MTTNHRAGSIVFGLVVGVVAAVWSYQWITDPERHATRQAEERAVLRARELLSVQLSIDDLQIVDPLATNRKVGKVYVYPSSDGWEISGYYRRHDGDRWHAFLLSVSPALQLNALKVDDDDPALSALARSDPKLEVSR